MNSEQLLPNIDLKDALGNKYNNHVVNFVFHTSDCERYDTRYMRDLAEKRAKESYVNFYNIPNWEKAFKLSKKDVNWMNYPSSNEMFGVTKKESDNLRYTEEYQKYINKSN